MIGIIVAMGKEFRLAESILEDRKGSQSGGFRFVSGRIAGKEVVLLQSGIGKVCAAVGTVEMIRNFRPSSVLNTGVAGGIDDSLRVMDIVVGTEVAYHDVWCGTGNEPGQVQGLPARYAADAALLEAVSGVRTDVALCRGLICSGDQFITDAEKLQAVKRLFPEGLAVDMESAAIAQVCHMYGVPFLSCRIVSDTPGHVENHALQYGDFWSAAPERTFEVLRQIIEKI